MSVEHPGEEQPLHSPPKSSSNSGKEVFLPEERTPRLNWQDKLAQRLVIRNVYARILLAEFLGTFVLVSLGCGSIAQAVVKNDSGNIVTIVFGWGMGVAFGVYVSGGFSGGHINPAVTTAMVVIGRLPLIKMPVYWAGQYLGAIFGAFCVFGVYYNGMDKIDGGYYGQRSDVYGNGTKTAGIFGTFPEKFADDGTSMLDQIFATMLLVLIAQAVTDKRNMHPVPVGMMPFLIGMGVVCILCGYAANCGGALNPARDFGPRVFTAMAGWKSLPFKVQGKVGYFWVPVLGPHVGAILGAIFYHLCVGLHLPDLIIANDQSH